MKAEMREIKFRAFDPLYKTMKQVNSIDWTHNYKVSSCKLDDFRWFNGHDTTPDFILMQYTGLRDENEKEIYEGDLVSYNNTNIFKVVFVAGCFKLSDINYPNQNLHLLEDIYSWLEVIGNIYENPIKS